MNAFNRKISSAFSRFVGPRSLSGPQLVKRTAYVSNQKALFLLDIFWMSVSHLFSLDFYVSGLSGRCNSPLCGRMRLWQLCIPSKIGLDVILNRINAAARLFFDET